MSEQPYVNQSIRDEHDKVSPESKRVTVYGWDVDSLQKVRLKLNSDGTLPDGISLPQYDAVSVSYPDSTTEVYTFKTGGLSGTTVATITITYTDSSKENISTVEKS